MEEKNAAPRRMVPDWRESYVICEHLFADADLDSKYSGFRVCCVACYPEFLFAPELDRREEGPFCIGAIPRKGDAASAGPLV